MQQAIAKLISSFLSADLLAIRVFSKASVLRGLRSHEPFTAQHMEAR